MGVRPKTDPPELHNGIDMEVVTISGQITVIVEAKTEIEAAEIGPKQAMLEEIERLKKDAGLRWLQYDEENKRRKEDTQESIRVIKKFYSIIRTGRLETYSDGKAVHVEWYSPQGLRKATLEPLSRGLLRALVDTITESPLAEDDCY